MKDPKVLSIKEALGKFVIGLHRTTRASTQSSLRLCIVMYILATALLKM